MAERVKVERVKVERPMYILRRVWKELGLLGHCYCRRIPGAYRDVWIVHHGRRYRPRDDRNDYKVVGRFVKRGRTALRKAGYPPKAFLFQADTSDSRAQRGSRVSEPLDNLRRAAMMEADMLPRSQWAKAAKGDWVGLQYMGDQVEMWEKSIDQKGDLYRVRNGGWTSTMPNAQHFDDVVYVGAGRGAWLYY